MGAKRGHIKFKNDQETFSLIYDNYCGRLLYVAQRYVKDKSLAEDVVHDSMIRIMEGVEQATFKSDIELYGWMRRIVINNALNLIKRESKLEFKDGLDYEMIKGDIFEVEEQDVSDRVRRVMEVLKVIPSGYRVVFSLYYMDGFKHTEIANELGVSVSTSKSQLGKARRMVKKLLEDRLKLVE